MLYINTNYIKAAMECVATGKAEPRYYLKGILFELTACGDVHLVSTDGEKMFCGRIPAASVQWSGARPEKAHSFILPYDALKQALKVKRFSTFIERLDEKENIYNINGITCEAIDGVFPNWRAVSLSAFGAVNAFTGVLPGMEWARMASVEIALRTWSGNKTATVRIKGENQYTGLLCYGDDTNCFALVMPQRSKEVTPDVCPSFPAAFDAQPVPEHAESMA